MHTVEKIGAFEMWCPRRALRISCVEHVSNDEVLEEVRQSRLLLGEIKSHKLRYFGRVARHPPQKDITLGYVLGKRRQRRQWLDDATGWTGLKLPEVVKLSAERGNIGSLFIGSSRLRTEYCNVM